MDGLLVLDKPGGMTSRDAVNRLMKALPRGTKVGHTGTLDPLATGVLVLCVGQATRLAEYVQDMDKEYLATVIFGATSDTDDADGVITPQADVAPVSETALRQELVNFIGIIDQSPPAYSAVKIDGRRAHALARQGQDVRPEARPVKVYDIELLEHVWPIARLRVACGKGTYIRSLARDLGSRLGVGGYISELRRTRVGPFLAEDGVSLSFTLEEIAVRLRPAAEALGSLHRLEVSYDLARRFCDGQPIAVPAGPLGDPRLCALFAEGGALVGIGLLGPDGVLEPQKVMPSFRNRSSVVEPRSPAG